MADVIAYVLFAVSTIALICTVAILVPRMIRMNREVKRRSDEIKALREKRAASITCPVCGATSHHPMDVREGYCGRCHDWTGERSKVEVRPRAGAIRRRDGSEVPVRFVPTEDPAAFLPVTVDGDPIVLQAGEQLSADVLGPGQSIVLTAEPPETA